MKIKNRAGAVLAVALALVVSACGGGPSDTPNAKDPTSPSVDSANGHSGGGESGGVLRLGHGGAPGDVLTQSVDHFNELLQEATDGRWSVENYGASQLGNERDLVEGVSLGTVDMTLVTNAPIGNFVPEALFYDLPGLYRDLDHVHAVAESPIIEEHFAPALLNKNLRLLGITDGGFRNITNSRGPVKTLGDLNGIKMRVQESPMIMATYAAIPGVTPVPVPIGDLYTALDQKIVDAQENPAILVRDFKINEVQDYMTLTGHSYFPRHLIINEAVWTKISEEDQNAFREAAAGMVEFKNNYYADETENAIAELRESGMQIDEPDPSFNSELADIMRREVYPQFYSEIGGGDADAGERLIQQIIELGE